MSYYWLVLTCSWLGSVSLQFVNPVGTGSEGVPGDNYRMNHHPLPYISYFNQPLRDNFGLFNGDPVTNLKTQYHSDEIQTDDLKRNRRMVEADKSREVWQENLPDLDKTGYVTDDEGEDNGPVIQNFANIGEDNDRSLDLINEMDKRSFSPWGGKRDNTNIEHSWTWKRATNVREPSMPKRVRFSPWGGKRSGQIVYKTGTKGSKIIFSTTVPELTRLVTNYSPNGKRLNLRGFQIVPSFDKRHPIKILAVTTKLDEQALREALPYKSFIEGLPRGFKPGHTYSDIALKTDGKRKVKFSAWGGKRSPPIIGPIWTPAPQDMKESTLDAILVIRNNPDPTQLITDSEQL